MKFKKLAAAVMVASLMSSTALAHTNSIGYVGDGSGGLNFWYGNWHGQAFNEAEIKITKPDGSTSIDAFNLLSQNSPAGLISGTNFFTSDGTQLVPYDPTGATNGGVTQESYVWQGINYTGLATGNYTFTYIPLGSAEGSFPNQSPTMDWMPMDNVILSLSLTLTQGDLNGDANNNGILDINEVAAGSASGAPTLVSTSAPYIDTASYSVWTAWATNTALEIQTQSSTAYTASETNTIQTIDREVTTVVTTPQIRTRTYNIIETETYSDNSTQDNILSTGNVETATQDDVVTTLSDPGSWTGRIDQTATAQDVVGSTLRTLDFYNIQGIRMNSKYDNGMSGGTTGVVVGGSKELENGVTIMGGFTRLGTGLTGNGDSVDAETTAFAAGIENNGVSLELRRANTDYDVSRTIGDFANTSETKGTDTSARIMYSPETGKINPVFGYTRGKRTMDGYTETGDVQSARTVASTDEMYGYGTVGLRGDLGLVDFTAMHHTDGVNDISIGIEKSTDRVTWRVEGTRSMTDLGTTNAVSAGLVIKF